MALKLSNNAISFLASGITAGATSITLKTGDGAKFPALGAGDYFPATISKPDGTFEIVRVTARSGDTLTVTRAQEGTTALAFNANSLIEIRLTAATFTNNTFEQSTTMLFVQSTAPVGWTKQTAHNDKALRIVSGTAGSGGTVDFTAAFASKTPSGSVSVSGTVGNTTLTIAQIPSHNHRYDRNFSDTPTASGGSFLSTSSSLTNQGTSYEGGGNSHTHSFSGSGSFTGSAIDLSVKYVDAIIATKD